MFSGTGVLESRVVRDRCGGAGVQGTKNFGGSRLLPEQYGNYSQDETRPNDASAEEPNGTRGRRWLILPLVLPQAFHFLQRSSSCFALFG